MEMVIPSRSPLGKHWLRALFTKEIKDVSKQSGLYIIPFSFSPFQSTESCGCVQGTHKIIWPMRALVPLLSEVTSRFPPPCGKENEAKCSKHSTRVQQTLVPPSPCPWGHVTCPVHITVAHVWYEDKSTLSPLEDAPSFLVPGKWAIIRERCL